MANLDQTKKALTESPALVPTDPVEKILERIDVRKKFNDMLGKKAAGFMTSIVSAVKANDYLKSCDPMSIVGSAAIAATLDLPINPNLGFAHIVPYSGIAQFQMGWKGFVQLGIRSGQYKTMHASEVYQDELKMWNPITAEFETTEQSTWKQRASGETDKIVGYVAFFKLTNGFEKYWYMDKESVRRHGKRYSKAFDNSKGQWNLNFSAMALKTVLKLLLSKYGLLSIEMQKAIQADQSSTTELDPEKQVYPDAIEAEADKPQVEVTKGKSATEIEFGE